MSMFHLTLSLLISGALLAPPAAAEKIRSAVPGLNLNYLSIFTAEARGFFRDENLENETIVIGGLVRDTMSETMNGVPLLMNIPLLGELFQQKQLSHRKVELIIFITPTIIQD